MWTEAPGWVLWKGPMVKRSDFSPKRSSGGGCPIRLVGRVESKQYVDTRRRELNLAGGEGSQHSPKSLLFIWPVSLGFSRGNRGGLTEQDTCQEGRDCRNVPAEQK